MILDFLHSTIKYIRGLHINETDIRSGNSSIKPILRSRNKAAFRGIIINTHSLINYYNEYIEEKQIMINLPTYNFLQDVIETFFGRIRMQNGFNNNPNELQFKGAYRKLLCNIKVQAPETGNCRLFDRVLPSDHEYSNIFTISSKRPKIMLENIDNLLQIHQQSILEDIVLIDELRNHNCTSFYTIAFIASRIEEKIIRSKFDCESCMSVFSENSKIEHIRLTFKIPCRSTYGICKHVDNFMKAYDLRRSSKNYNFQLMYCLIFRTLDFSTLFVNSFSNCDINHKYSFIKCMVMQYVAIKAAYICREITFEQYEKIFRHQLNKLVLFKGQ